MNRESSDNWQSRGGMNAFTMADKDEDLSKIINKSDSNDVIVDYSLPVQKWKPVSYLYFISPTSTFKTAVESDIKSRIGSNLGSEMLKILCTTNGKLRLRLREVICSYPPAPS